MFYNLPQDFEATYPPIPLHWPSMSGFSKQMKTELDAAGFLIHYWNVHRCNLLVMYRSGCDKILCQYRRFCVGETCRTIRQRVAEHKSACNGCWAHNLELTEYRPETGHEIEWSQTCCFANYRMPAAKHPAEGIDKTDARSKLPSTGAWMRSSFVKAGLREIQWKRQFYSYHCG
ncbi:unnamed protein product [Protopolystoma xenopodis]|uniref:Uncharacterized protein n=1 Tax=Protopolystoma xenopodis TaxID=117903 RepID=A0A3S5A4B7_9PLAT|nr:unnamed protein product [Protopolystoma xenopodis]